MKKLAWSMAAGLGLLAGTTLFADEKMDMKPYVGSAQFEKIKKLAGKWEGTSKMGNEDMKVSVDYRVTSGGSAVMETLSPGTSHEMVSLYHDKAGKLFMTHYCMLGNQPELELKNIDNGRMNFESSAQTRADLKGQMYMNSLALEQLDKNQLVQTWTAVNADGKPLDSSVFTLKKKS